MGALDLLKVLMSEGVEFETNGGGAIRWRNAQGRMTPEVVRTLQAERDAVVAFICCDAAENAATQSEEDLCERFEERAAIMEYDGGLWREEAERLAGSVSMARRCDPFGTLGERPERRPSSAVPSKCSEPRTDPDALLSHLRACGPSSYGGAATSLGMGASRAWRAEAALVAAGLVRLDGLGRMILIEEAQQ